MRSADVASPARRRASLHDVPVLTLPPDVIVAILRSARTAAPDPRLESVLQAFRHDWERLARRRYASLGDGVDDAVQSALVKLISPAKLAAVKDVARVASWARSIFVHAVMDVARDARRHRGQRLAVGPDDDPEEALRDRLPASDPSPEEQVAERERLGIVAQCIERLEIARLRFVEDLPEKEIAERLGLSRDGVAGQLKRIRKAIRNALGDPE